MWSGMLSGGSSEAPKPAAVKQNEDKSIWSRLSTDLT